MYGAGVARMSVLERQQVQLNGQLMAPQHAYFGCADQQDYYSTPPPASHFHGLCVSPDTSEFGFGGGELGTIAGCGINYGVSRTASCPPAVAAALAAAAGKRKEAVVPEKPSAKKRKADKVVPEDNNSKDNKRKKSVSDEENKVNNSKPEASSETSKVSDAPRTDYIHVRARRGQATDSHSLAERVRREKISERMKYLQDIVPGCNKITGKAGMLDEIINYVQSLQRQVEFLSMKLAVVNPRTDLDNHSMFSKEVFAVGTSEHLAIEESSGMNDPSNYNFASLEQVVSSCGLEADKNLHDMALRRSISAPVSLHEAAPIEPSYFNVINPYPTWDAELQSLYGLEFQQGGRSCSGVDGSGSVKMEM